MTNLGIQFVLFAAAFLPADAPAPDARWGNLKGQFVYDGPPPVAPALNVPPAKLGNNPNPADETLLVDAKGGIANVVVYVRSKEVKIHPRALKDLQPQVVLTAKDLRFSPHILPLMTTQTLVVTNAEDFAVNANVTELGGAGMNSLLAPGAQARYQYTRPQALPQQVTDNIHPWQRAYVLARDNPYFAVSKTDGTFEMHGLPLGSLEFQVWQEKAGWIDTKDWPKGRLSLEIGAGDNDLGIVKLDPQVFKR